MLLLLPPPPPAPHVSMVTEVTHAGATQVLAPVVITTCTGVVCEPVKGGELNVPSVMA